MKNIYSTLLGILFSSTIVVAQCDFTISNTNPCGEEPIVFTVTNPSGTYGWDFDGDGNIDAYGNTVTYTFPQLVIDKVYTIELYQDNVSCGTVNLVILASPDPALGVVPGNAIIEDNLIRVCSPTPEATLQLINLSSTIVIDNSYFLNWGDGTIDTFTVAEFGTTGFIEHDYADYGYYNLSITSIANNGCQNIENYTFYNGSNPSVGLANPGNTVGLCAPATIDFPITNYLSNPTGTEYHIYVGGELVASFTQADVPAVFSYTFLETSCGLTTSTGNYTNAFDVQVEAVNPCGSSQATIEPIEISTPPELEFEADVPGLGCTEEPITITNASTNVNEVISGNPSTCASSITPSWTITPGTAGIDWDIISGNIFGSNEIEIVFNTPGEYMVTMHINSQSCGAGTYSQTFQILENPVAGGDLDLNTDVIPTLPNECAPTTGTFTNLSSGDSLSYTWQVSPNSGWAYTGGSTENDDDVLINFLEAGTYTVGLLVENNCASDLWDTTFVIASDPIVTLGPFPTFCDSGTLNIDQSDVNYNANGGLISSYSWQFSGANPNSSTDQYPTGIHYDSPGSYTVTLITENQCGTTTSTAVVEVQAPGNLVIDNDQIVCEQDAPFTLFSNPSTGYWTGNGVGLNGLFTPSQQNIGDNLLIYYYGEGSCLLVDSLVVTVLPMPAVDAGIGQEACVDDDPFILEGGSPANGIWTSNNGGVIEGGEAFNPAASGPGTYTLTYTYQDSNGCEDSDTKSIIVHDLPEVEAGADLSICENPNDITLVGYTPTGGSWSGTGVSTNGIFNASNTPGQGTYKLTYNYSNPNTGCSKSDSIFIQVIANDTAYANVDLEMCIDEGILSLNDGEPSGGIWSGAGISNGNFFDPILAGPGDHIITYTFGTGICETEDTRLIKVYELPELQLPADKEICINSNVIDLSSASPIGGTWTGTGVSGNSFDPSLAGTGLHLLTYTYTNPNSGCSSSDQINIEVFDLPEINVNDSTYCFLPGIVELPFASPASGSWQGPGLVGAQSFDPEQTTGVGNHIFTYTVTDNNSCTNFQDVNITLIAPSAIEAGPNDSICIDQGLLTLNNFSPAGGFWTGDGIIDEQLGIFDPSLVNEGTHVLTYSAGVGNCQVTDTKIVFVIDLTGVGVGGPEEFCEFDDDVMLEASGPEGGIWTGPGITQGEDGIFDPGLAGAGVHILSYEYEDPILGCIASATKEITVHAQTPVDFEFPNVGCEDKTIAFQNNSNENDDMLWDFGDGNTSISMHPLHIYQEVGTYEIILIAENSFGCRDSLTKNLLITETPEPAFQLNTYFGCGPLEVDFSNQSSGHDVSFDWDFGNGITSDSIHPEPVVFEAGINDSTYYISLVVSNLCGNQLIEDSVTVRPQPHAEFAFSPEEPCSPMTVNFGNISSGSVESFYWDFANGNSSTDTVPLSQIYVTDTTVSYYDVSLVAINQCGTDTSVQTIQVNPADVRAFFTSSGQTGCQPFTVDFSNFATPGANVDWDFGDGNSTIELSPTHTFETPGEYTVIQYATSDCGYDTMTMQIEVLPSPEVAFEHVTYVCLGNSVTFLNNSINTFGNEWDFGDGTGSTLTSPEHIYTSPGTYTVTLIGYSQFNQCPSTFESEIIVQGLPSAEFEPVDSYGCAPFNAAFNNNSQNADFFFWDFGDGNTAVGDSPNHLYEYAGTFEIKLIATDAYGCSNDTSIINVLVNPSPIASFEFDQEAQCSLPANFTFENSSEGAGGFQWDFGDGAMSQGNQPTHTYTQEGSYEVSLIATNQFGCIDSTLQELSVTAQPVADFDASDFQGCSPVTTSFTNASNYGDSFLWIFGDGQTSEEENPVVTFTAPGFHAAQLIVGSQDLCFDTVTVTSMVQVYQEVHADFTAEEVQDGFSSGTYELTNNSRGADTYYWEFSDGGTSEEISPTHRFLENTAHTIYLEASNEFGCVDDTLISFTPDFIKGLHIPTGFSPEQGLEQVRVFKPAGIGLKEYRVQIFSPYGQLLWESDELTEDGAPAASWDGRFEGQLLPQDVYVWKAFGMFRDGTVWAGERNEGGELQTIGSVILLR